MKATFTIPLSVMIFLLFGSWASGTVVPSLTGCESYLVPLAARSSDLDSLISRFGPAMQLHPSLLVIAPSQASPKAIEEIEQEIEAMKRYLALSKSDDEIFVLVSSYGGFPIPAFAGLIYDRGSGRLKARFQTKTVKRRQIKAKLYQAFDSIRLWSFREKYSSEFILSAFALHRRDIKTRVHLNVRSPFPIGGHQIKAGRERLRRNSEILERIVYITEQLQTVSLDDL